MTVVNLSAHGWHPLFAAYSLSSRCFDGCGQLAASLSGAIPFLKCYASVCPLASCHIARHPRHATIMATIRWFILRIIISECWWGSQALRVRYHPRDKSVSDQW